MFDWFKRKANSSQKPMNDATTGDVVDEVAELYEQARAAKTVEERIQKYKLAFAKTANGKSPDDQSRAKLFATELGRLLIKLKDRRGAKEYFDFLGERTPSVQADPLPFDHAIEVLRSQGLLSELMPEETKRILDELHKDGADGHASVVEFLRKYYRGDSADKQPSQRAIKDGFLDALGVFDWNWGHETDDVTLELRWISMLVGDPLFLQQNEYGAEEHLDQPVLAIKNQNGDVWKVQVESTNTIIAQFNREMQRIGDARLFVAFGGGDAYLLVDQMKYEQLFGDKNPALGSSGLSWEELSLDTQKWFASWDVQ